MTRRRRATPPPDLRARCTPTQAAQLDALYAELPEIECRGQCWDSCTTIDMTPPERARIADAGYDIPEVRGLSVCPALTMFHQCAVYEVRPLICHLFGVAEGLTCNFGCQPTRLLTRREVFELQARAYDIAGMRREAELSRRALASPHAEALLRRHLADQEEIALHQQAEQRAHLSRTGAAPLWLRGRGRLERERPASGANSGEGM